MLLRCESLEPPMSQLGQTRPSRAIGDMSPIPPLTAVMLQRNERQKRAMSGREHLQQNCTYKTPPYSITSSARASTVVGISRPSALAVLRLMTSSYFVGA
jgi:hypothetical protein